jgi:subtilisin family serine protease
MALTEGRTEVVIGLLDGPVALDHPDLSTAKMRAIPGIQPTCGEPGSPSCQHGTFVAGILSARRGSQAPAIAPDCTLVVRPVFSETSAGVPTATAEELADAIADCVDAGANVLNVSAALVAAPIAAERALDDALGHAVRRGAIVVAAAGNQGAMAGSVITRHPWVIPVAAYSGAGRPLAQSNMAGSIGRRGLGAPGEGVASLVPGGASVAAAGTSIAAPFVTAAAALLWSVAPWATADEVKGALLGSSATRRRRTIAPPLLDAWGAYEVLASSQLGRAMS